MTDQDLWTVLTARFEQSIALPESFFDAAAETIAAASEAVARRFQQGGRLLAMGIGACATDAQHISVEFVHPVIVGKRALPALALSNAVGSSFARQIDVLARPEDIALGFSPDGLCQDVNEALVEARGLGLLTLGLTGGDGGLFRQSTLDFCFVVPSRDPVITQEIHETLYHILWELVHVFCEHEEVLQSPHPIARS